MHKANNLILQELLGKLIFSRVKYLDEQNELLAVPAVFWLVEQLKPKQILAINSSASLYFAVCQAAEKSDADPRGIKCFAQNSRFSDDQDAIHYHQQQYSELSELTSSLQPALQQAQLVIINPEGQQQTALDALFSELSQTESIKAVAISTSQAQTIIHNPFSAHIALPQLDIYWHKGQLPVLDKLQNESELFGFLTQVLNYISQALSYRVKASQCDALQLALRLQQQNTRDQASDNAQLKQQVTQQALQIERQHTELASLTQNQLLTEQANTRLQQFQLDKELLLQQLEQQYQLLQKQHSNISQQLRARTVELANLTIKLEQFNSQDIKLLQLQQENSQLIAQAKEDKEKLVEFAQVLQQKDDLQQDKDALQQQKDDLQQDKDALQQQKDNLQQDKSVLQQQNEQLQVQLLQLRTEFNEKEKQNFFVQQQQVEAQHAIQQYQREVAQLTLMLQQREHLRHADSKRIQNLQQQIKKMQQLKIVKLANAIVKLKHPFAKNPKIQQLQKHKALLAQSGWFEEQWYLTTYPDVASQQQDAILHYLKFGGFEGRKPHPNFDSQWYIQQYPDVAAQGINPLLHFIKFGQHEGRRTQAEDLQ